MPMKISVIREAIKSAGYVRASLSGGTSEEFKRQSVGPRLATIVEELTLLEIPERYVNEIRLREQEIRRCNEVIVRWNSGQEPKGGQAPPRTCPHGKGFNCPQCWPQPGAS